MESLQERIEIILVEDNPDDAALIKAALEENNIVNNVIHLKDGADALDFLFHEGAFATAAVNENPKIIMLDLNMPKVGGLEFLRKVKTEEKTKKIPIVVFTSSKDDPNLRECYSLGVKNYIIKPLDFNQFKIAINKSITGLLLYTTRFNPLG
jgi:two-component system response regulator